MPNNNDYGDECARCWWIHSMNNKNSFRVGPSPAAASLLPTIPRWRPKQRRSEVPGHRLFCFMVSCTNYINRIYPFNGINWKLFGYKTLKVSTIIITLAEACLSPSPKIIDAALETVQTHYYPSREIQQRSLVLPNGHRVIKLINNQPAAVVRWMVVI